MGKTLNSGLGTGTGTSPQQDISQTTVDSRIDIISKYNVPFDSSKFSYEESLTKYDSYLFNLNNADGAPKAKFLKETLNYQVGDSEKLHNAIKEAIDNKIPTKITQTAYGIKLNFKIKLKGNSGVYQYANVVITIQNDNGKENWRLITLIPDKKDKE